MKVKLILFIGLLLVSCMVGAQERIKPLNVGDTVPNISFRVINWNGNLGKDTVVWLYDLLSPGKYGPESRVNGWLPRDTVRNNMKFDTVKIRYKPWK